MEQGRKSSRGVQSESPYREFALLYDDTVGKYAFECWKERFEIIESRFGFSFDTAADIACGTGLAVLYLKSRCKRVYGVDGSAWMLDVAKRRVRSEDVIFLQQKFTEICLPERVDLLTCNFDSINYILEENELELTIEKFASSLNSGGWAVFDVNTENELRIEDGNDLQVHRCRQGVSIWESDWNEKKKILTISMTNFISIRKNCDEMKRETHCERAYPLDYLKDVILRSGFKECYAFDAYDLGGVSRNTRRIQFVCRAGR